MQPRMVLTKSWKFSSLITDRFVKVTSHNIKRQMFSTAVSNLRKSASTTHNLEHEFHRTTGPWNPSSPSKLHQDLQLAAASSYSNPSFGSTYSLNVVRNRTEVEAFPIVSQRNFQPTSQHESWIHNLVQTEGTYTGCVYHSMYVIRRINRKVKCTSTTHE